MKLKSTMEYNLENITILKYFFCLVLEKANTL